PACASTGGGGKPGFRFVPAAHWSNIAGRHLNQMVAHHHPKDQMAETTPTPQAGASLAPRAGMAPQGDRAAERRAALWAVLHDDNAPQADYFAAWLTLQCEALPGATGGLLLLRTAEGASHAQASWPVGAPSAARDL